MTDKKNTSSKNSQNKSNNKKKKSNPIPKGMRTKAKKIAREYDIHMSKCASKYLLARLDPFNPAALGACVPRTPAPPSVKFATRGRGIMSGAGLGNVAAVKWTPSAQSNSNEDRIYFTDAIGAVTFWPGTYWSTTPGVARGGQVGSSYDSSLFAAGDLECRLVGAGLRVRPITQNLLRGGLVLGYSTPTGNAYIAANNFSQNASDLQNAKIQSGSDDGWLTIVQDLDDPDLHDYSSSFVFNGNTTQGHATLFAMAQCVDNSTDTQYEFETIAHWEAKGRLVTSQASRNETDVVGFGLAANAASAVSRSAEVLEPSSRVEKALDFVRKEVSDGTRIVRKGMEIGSSLSEIGQMVGLIA